MAEVRLKTSLSGPGGSFGPGDIYECSEAEAKRFIDRDYAEPVQAAKKPAAKSKASKPAKKSSAAE